MKKYFVFGLCFISQLGLIGQIQFENIAQNAGIRHFKTEFSIGNGVSFVDFNNDGWDDLTIGTTSGKFIDFYVNEQGTFKRIFPLVTHRHESKQINWVDFDNDGDKDLYVASLSAPNRLYENQGDLKMVDITEQSKLPMNDEYTYGAIWGDFDRDGWLDLYFGNHKDVQHDKYNKLFHNNGDGTFTDVSDDSGSADLNKVPFCSAFFDFNNDNWPDIYTANDKLSFNTLLMNEGAGRFSDVSARTNTELRMNAMCVNVGDFDNDGWQDIYITNTPVGNRLLRNLGSDNINVMPVFEEVAEEVGVGYFGHGWASNFLDADNDGDLDLYVNGSAKIRSQGNKTSIFYENMGDGTFTIPESGMGADSATSYVNAIGDINNDGFPDIAVQNNPPYYHHLWQNSGGDNRWLKVNLTGVLSNKDAVGAKVEVYSEIGYQQRYRHCGSGFMGQNSTTLLFGLNTFAQADSIIITWPTGHIDRLYDVAADQIIALSEGATTNGIIDVMPGLNIMLPTAVSSKLKPLKLDFYPNPVQDHLWITHELQGDLHYQIMDLQGKVVKKGKFSQNKIQISDVSSGSYVILMQTEQQEIYSALFQKQ
ncbi:MAG: FG-GAP-like repeat-containing protein [Bacteroidota bacterium]